MNRSFGRVVVVGVSAVHAADGSFMEGDGIVLEVFAWFEKS